MASDKNDGLDPELQPKKKSSTLMVVLVGVIALAAGGGGAFFMLKKKAHAAEGPHGAAGAGETGAALGKLVTLDSFIVNLNESKSTRYLKVTFAAELASDELESRLKERKEVVRDRVITYLSGLTVDEVRGSETKEAIREMVAKRLNEALGRKDGVRSVLFTEFVVQ